MLDSIRSYFEANSKPIEVQAFGQTIYVKRLNAYEELELDKRKVKDNVLENLLCYIIEVACDSTGQQLFTEADKDLLKTAPLKDILTVFNAQDNAEKKSL